MFKSIDNCQAQQLVTVARLEIEGDFLLDDVVVAGKWSMVYETASF